MSPSDTSINNWEDGRRETVAHISMQYQNKMVGGEKLTTLTRRYDLPSGRVFYQGDVVNLDKWPELKIEVMRDRKIATEIWQAEIKEEDE